MYLLPINNKIWNAFLAILIIPSLLYNLYKYPSSRIPPLISVSPPTSKKLADSFPVPPLISVSPSTSKNLPDSSPVICLIPVSPSTRKNPTARLAYYISGGSTGDGERLKRILQAVYHPYNVYIVQLGKTRSPTEHQELSDYISSHPVFSSVRNINMYADPDFVMEDSRNKIDNMIFAAMLLKQYEWDWLVNLDASDYPLVTQDDLLYVLSHMPRHLNFIDHIYDFRGMHEEQPMQVVKDLREFYYLFVGTPWMGLTRSFIEYFICDWGSLPQSLLLDYHTKYQADSIYSNVIYFQTVICNAHKFNMTVVDTDFRFTVWDNPSSEHHRYITMRDYGSMLESNAPFARKFNEEYSHDILNLIDQNFLSRGPNMLVPGGWCAGTQMRESHIATRSKDPCLRVGDVTNIRPGPGVMRLQRFLDHLVHDGIVSSPQCEVNG